MIRFEIRQIGGDVEPTAGIPDGCELCGHCGGRRRVLGERAAGCGATVVRASPITLQPEAVPYAAQGQSENTR